MIIIKDCTLRRPTTAEVIEDERNDPKVIQKQNDVTFRLNSSATRRHISIAWKKQQIDALTFTFKSHTNLPNIYSKPTEG